MEGIRTPATSGAHYRFSARKAMLPPVAHFRGVFGIFAAAHVNARKQEISFYKPSGTDARRSSNLRFPRISPQTTRYIRPGNFAEPARHVAQSHGAVGTAVSDDSPRPSPREADRSPFLLLDPARQYTHASPGVCDACSVDPVVRGAWVELLLGQKDSHRANAARTARTCSAAGAEGSGAQHPTAEDFLAAFEQWEAEYFRYLEESRQGDGAGGGPSLLDMVRWKEHLVRQCGLGDVFQAIKQEENAVAATMFAPLCAELDALAGASQRARVAAVLECSLAGNLFDAGSAAAVAGVAFCEEDQCEVPFASADEAALSASVDSLAADRVADTFRKIRERVARPPTGWRYDNLQDIAQRLSERPWQRVVIFCDNAGADLMGMVLLARHLAGCGGAACRVLLAANSSPALNDVTFRELQAFLAQATAADAVLADHMHSGRICSAPSGQDSTLLDLSQCSQEVQHWIEEGCDGGTSGSGVGELTIRGDDWLVVLDGMGRSLESNWEAGKYMRRGVSTLNLAMIKTQINAERLDAEVYDCVCRLTRAD